MNIGIYMDYVPITELIRLLYYLPMERMGVEYQRFDGKEYVSLKKYNNLLCKYKALEEENEKLKEELQHYENTKAIQKSNDTSRWKPGCMSYVDRELNHF